MLARPRPRLNNIRARIFENRVSKARDEKLLTRSKVTRCYLRAKECLQSVRENDSKHVFEG